MIGRLNKRLRSESGMSMAEVMIASLILAASSLAVLNLVASGARTNYRAEQSQVVSDRLQSEMEKVKQLADNASYDRIALTAAPAHSNDPNDPAYRVSGATYNVAPHGTLFQPLVIDGAGMAPVSQFTSGDVHGTIHRFVVWEPDTACDDCKKRVVVAIQLDATASGGVRHYQELQAVIADPRAPDRENPIPPPPSDPQPWTFWLTDTPCNNGDRQPLTGDHLTHNTRGVCSAGLKNANNCTASGCVPGAPDLMVSHPPQLSAEDPLFNFATDVLSSNPSQDKGIRLLRAATSGCPALDIPAATEVSNPPRFQEIHKWLSPPIPTGFNVQLNGEGTLNLWTRAVGSSNYSGRICIWLFQRTVDGSGVTTDTPAGNTDAPGQFSFQYSQSRWPKPKWEELAIPLHFSLAALAPGSQLGLAIQVERLGTNGGGLQFFYDEPSYDSRLEVKSASALPCGSGSWPSCPAGG
jgi:Tfp pilus assembly protein PilV